MKPRLPVTIVVCFVLTMMFDTAFAQWKTMKLDVVRSYSSIASIGTKVFFAGDVKIDVLDQSTGNWTQLSRPHLGGKQVAVIGTKLIYGSGQDVDIYDNATGNWTSITLSQQRFGYAVATFGTKVLFASGNSSTNATMTLTNVVDIYDTETGSQTTTTLTSPGYNFKAVTIGDEVFIGPGEDTYWESNSAFSDVVNIYHTTDGSWTTTTLPEDGVFMSDNAIIGNKVFFSGFWKGNGLAQKRGPDFVAEYVSETNSWTTPVPLAAEAWSSGRAFAIVNEKAVFFGGDGGLSNSNAFVYDVTSGEMSDNNSAVLNAAGASRPVAGVAGSKVYTAGYEYSSYYTSINIYNDDTLNDFEATGPSEACMGKVAFTASGAATYQWEFDLHRPATSTVEVDFNELLNVNQYPYNFVYGAIGIDADGFKKIKYFTITLNANPTITLPASTNLCLGSSANLTATGADTYSWSPSTALSATTGSTVTANPISDITYTVTGTNSHSCTASKSITVTIKPVPAKPTATLSTSGDVAMMISNATSGNQWFLDGDPIDGAVNQVLPVFEVGDYSVQVTTNGCASLMSNVVNYDVTAGVNEVSSLSTIQAYPNPVADYLNFKWTGFADGQQIDLQIIDLAGRRVYEGKVYTTDCSVDATSWATGLYIVHARQSGARQVLRIAKK